MTGSAQAPAPAGMSSDEGQPVPAKGDADRRSERLVALFFQLSALGAVGFVVDLWAGNITLRYYSIVLGLCLAISLTSAGIAAILWAKKLMPREEAVQEREPFHSEPEDSATAAAAWNAGVVASGLTHRPLLRRSFLLASSALALPAVGALRYLADRPHGELNHTAWTAGSLVVTEDNVPIKLGDLQIGGFLTVFPEGAVSSSNSAAVIIRLRPEEIHPRPGRADWAYQGHVVYSKICTHAGCPVGLYEEQTHHLLCPCHQSTFQVTDGCRPIFGPAPRSLPQLNIGVNNDGYFFAKADFAEPVGPGFWERKP